MQPNAVPPTAWHTVTIDHVTGVPKTANKHNAVAVFVDELTEYVILGPCSKESSGADWAYMFIDNVYVHFGLPEHILSDRGTQFTGLFIKSIECVQPTGQWDSLSCSLCTAVLFC